VKQTKQSEPKYELSRKNDAYYDENERRRTIKSRRILVPPAKQRMTRRGSADGEK
jgi:hypothetical protein